MTRHVFAAALAAACLLTPPALAQDAAPAAESWLPSLITQTPEQGFDLAVTMARRAVKTTQPDVEVLHAQRPVYSQDAGSLIRVADVVSGYFATIAAANDYWRN